MRKQGQKLKDLSKHTAGRWQLRILSASLGTPQTIYSEVTLSTNFLSKHAACSKWAKLLGARDPGIYLLLVVKKKGDRLRIDGSVVRNVCTRMRT